jgi:predicted esterase
MSTRVWLFALVTLIVIQQAPAQDDVADIPSEELRADKDENKRFFLIGPPKEGEPPAKGYGLVVILPGGSGSADFHPFVKRIYKHSIPDGYLVAQLVAPKWTDEQSIVWPTSKNRADKMKFSTEQFVDAVIEDVAKRQKVNPERVFTLSWSSGGPAAYAASLTSKKITGSFIAMSVFKPEVLPALDSAKGHGYFIYHSRNDRVCPFRMAQQAADDLKKSGAAVELKTYEGGHGWMGGFYGHIREGVEWLEANHAPQARKKSRS